MFGFKKKETAQVEFTATKDGGVFQIDQPRRLVRVKEGVRGVDKYAPFSIDDIMDIEIQCDDTVVNKKNLGAAFAGGALFGVGGLLLAGSHQKQFIQYMGITIKLRDLDRPIVKLPLITMKMKKDGGLAKAMMKAAEDFVQVLNIMREEA